MPDSPNLKVVLFANNVEVASSTDNAVWLSTMAAITGIKDSGFGNINAGSVGASKPPSDKGGPLAEFAKELGVSVEQLTGAASPTADAPYIHLDHKYWEALKQNTPPRGVGSVSGVVLSATLLLLWNRHMNFGKVTGAMCDGVMATIGHTEKNRLRSLKGCEWIQVREEGLRINPASISNAIKLATAYATKGIVK